ncbi:hypothetical protein D9757_014283 [Collybiopsis confluens]|uniref:non-specific serine/threonine protein kinase n=1 Tax=Collybiopsis confluens TaxID=2823264 RepID=A0A8H5CS48_9AGAR|nr:hypothetical protein D9757_014283 [Collybiopsis confluens]
MVGSSSESSEQGRDRRQAAREIGNGSSMSSMSTASASVSTSEGTTFPTYSGIAGSSHQLQSPPRVILKPEYTIVFEVRGKLVDWVVVLKEKMDNPRYLYVLQEVVLPKLQTLDHCQNMAELKLHTKLYKITFAAFTTLHGQFMTRTFSTLNMNDSSAFQLGLEDILPDYTLVVFCPPGSVQVDPNTQPFFLTEPTLACQQPTLSPSRSELYPTFIRVQSGGEFSYDDLALNNIEFVPNTNISDVTVPSHVQKIWNALSQKRNITRDQLKTLERKLAKRHPQTSYSLEDLFTVLQEDKGSMSMHSQASESPPEPMLELERDHYGHVIKCSGVCSPHMNTFSSKVGVEKSSEYFFFTNYTIYFLEHLPQFDILDPYQPMPITKLVVEKLDEQLDVHRFAPYYPKSDMGVWYHGSIWPALLAEFHSGKTETAQIEHSPDHMRMFLQGASLLRMINIARRNADDRKGKSPLKTAVLPLNYITKDWSRASMYLLFEVGSHVYYLRRLYDIHSGLIPRLRFTRDLYNLANHIKETAPLDQVKESLQIIDAQLHNIKTVAHRVDKEDDKKRKRGNDGEKGGGAKEAKQKRKENSDNVDATLEKACLDEAARLGYKLSVKSPCLLVGDGPRGGKVIVKKVQSNSEELKIHLKLQSFAGAKNFVLPILQRFDLPSEGPTTSTYLVFSRWTPLSEVRALALTSSQLVAACSALARGVKFLHDNLVAHLDLKPDNLIIQRGELGRISLRIIDFSVSTILLSKDEKRDSYQGTIGLMAPEVAENEEPGNCRILYSPLMADLFSCGRVFQFLAWGITNEVEFHQVLNWANSLIAHDPALRPELANLPGLLVSLASPIVGYPVSRFGISDYNYAFNSFCFQIPEHASQLQCSIKLTAQSRLHSPTKHPCSTVEFPSFGIARSCYVHHLLQLTNVIADCQAYLPSISIPRLLTLVDVSQCNLMLDQQFQSLLSDKFDGHLYTNFEVQSKRLREISRLLSTAPAIQKRFVVCSSRHQRSLSSENKALVAFGNLRLLNECITVKQINMENHYSRVLDTHPEKAEEMLRNLMHDVQAQLKWGRHATALITTGINSLTSHSPTSAP